MVVGGGVTTATGERIPLAPVNKLSRARPDVSSSRRGSAKARELRFNP